MASASRKTSAFVYGLAPGPFCGAVGVGAGDVFGAAAFDAALACDRVCDGVSVGALRPHKTAVRTTTAMTTKKVQPTAPSRPVVSCKAGSGCLRSSTGRLASILRSRTLSGDGRVLSSAMNFARVFAQRIVSTGIVMPKFRQSVPRSHNKKSPSVMLGLEFGAGVNAPVSRLSGPALSVPASLVPGLPAKELPAAPFALPTAAACWKRYWFRSGRVDGPCRTRPPALLPRIRPQRSSPRPNCRSARSGRRPYPARAGLASCGSHSQT
jgi:hypothetical protein